jgi:hypothetical protein
VAEDTTKAAVVVLVVGLLVANIVLRDLTTLVSLAVVVLLVLLVKIPGALVGIRSSTLMLPTVAAVEAEVV